MNIVAGKPPNFAAIAQVLPAARQRGTIFTYGDTVYVNSPVAELTPQLKAHEAVHVQRQRSIGVELWWIRYLQDSAFRLYEELLAHRAEYGTVKSLYRDRNIVSRHLHGIAARLASPLYGGLITQEQARRLIMA